MDSDGAVRSSFGAKTISFVGSFALNLNNCMGPAMVLLPLVNQLAGWLTPSIALLLTFVFSSFAATMLCEAMQRIPGNRSFRRRFEFATLVDHYYGRHWYVVAQVFYIMSLQATNIAAMIISAQVADRFVSKVVGTSFALNYGEFPPHFMVSLPDESAPWGDTTLVISLGFVVCMVICIPFGFMNLDDNMGFQYFSLAGLVTFTCEFAMQFIINCIPGSGTYVGPSELRPGNGPGLTPLFAPGQLHVLGVSTFAFAYVVGIPSWVNEKKLHVNVNKAVWLPAVVGLLMKFVIGILGGWAFLLVQDGVPVKGSDDILTFLAQARMPQVTQYSTYLWSMTTLVPGIPPFAIMIRYNLLSGGVCGPTMSFFWAVVFPWIVVAFCYEASLLTHLCNWVALLGQGFVNFVAPAILYRSAILRYPNDGFGKPISGPATPINWHSSMPLSMKNAEEEEEEEEAVNAVPEWIACWIARETFALVIAGFFTVLCLGAIGLNIAGLFGVFTNDTTA